MATASLVTLWKELHATRTRDRVRAVAIDLFSGWQRLVLDNAGYLRAPRVHILSFHHVFPNEEIQFRRLLSWLSLTHTFVRYSDAIDRIRTGRIDRPYVAFTFDDGLKSGIRAAEILSEFGARACFFVCPSAADIVDPQKLAAFCSERLRIPPVAMLTWGDLEDLVKHSHEIGGHGMNHLRASELTKSQMQSEIGDCFNALSQKLGRIHHFAWAFGRFEDFSPIAAKIAFNSGYTSIASGERGCHVHQRAGTSLCLRREHVVCGWPLRHIEYFLVNSIVSSKSETGAWPPGWVID